MSNEGFRGVPGVPEGWELVRIGIIEVGEYRLMMDRSVRAWEGPHPSTGWVVIVRKIETPKQYRPFANAEEFKPHRDRWWRDKEKSYVYAPSTYGDDYHCGASWESSFVNKLFDDGSVFGVEVIE